jgi:ABC-2 type transport system ATP-binding protein
MSSAPPVLKTSGLSKRYGKRLALAGLDLEVPAGRVFGFLGPNGAGKTTCISLVLGLISATGGQVELFGQDTRHHLAASLKRVGAILEGVSFYPHLSARDNLRVCAAISGGDSPGRIESTLGQVGLAARAKDKVRGYSMGMRQRLALAAALLHDPELLVLDEPTNGLDPAGMREFRDLIRELGRSGKTVFVSSHLLGEVEQMCDEVAIVKEGRVIASGAVADLVRRSDALEMRVTNAAKAVEALATLPWPVSAAEGDRLTVEAPRDSAPEISRALADNQVYLYELRPRETSLEEIFLELTSEEAAG